ncbi:MAG: DNA polymerase II [Gammaproteobacteria bacterium]|nr:DNA polymerase II [Gammaproteobacteria bacterium]
MQNNIFSQSNSENAQSGNIDEQAMVAPELGFLLSRNQYDKYGRCIFEFWVKTDDGICQLIVQGERPTCFAVASDSEIISRLLKERKVQCEIKPLTLKTFQRQPCIGLYTPNLREYQKLRRACQEHKISLLEDDIKPVDRFLMERFIKGSLLFIGSVKPQSGYRQINDCRIKSAEYVTEFSNVSVDIECDEQGHLYSIGLYSSTLPNCDQSNEHLFFKKVLYNTSGVDSQCLFEPQDHIEWLDNEKLVLQRFVNVIQEVDPDLIIGWNFVKFDIRVLQKAAERTNVSLDIGRDFSALVFSDGTRDGDQAYPDKAYVAGRTVLDGIEVMKNATYNFSSFSLDAVAREVLSEHKLIQAGDKRSKLEQIKHQYRFSPIELAEYNLQDCKLVADIFAKEKLTDFLITRTRLTGLELERVGGSVAAFTNLYLPHVHRKGWVAPNLVRAEDYVHSPGGYVMDSIPGIHKDVLVFDFKSLYPSIMRTFNIDPIALIEADQQEELQVIPGFRGGKFSRNKSVLSGILDDLWQAREQAKAQKNAVWSNAIKIIMNSFYGVLGSAGCRFYDTKLASSITMRGHWILSESKKWFEQQGLTVIYGDTDSIFVSFSDDKTSNDFAFELERSLNTWWQEKLKLDFNIDSKLEIEFETHFSPFFMPTIRGKESGSKKRYAGFKLRQESEPELVFKGLESVRSDWTELAKVFQTELFKRVFSDQECDSYIAQILEQLRNGQLDNLLVYKKRIRRKLHEYIKTTPPHIRAARQSNLESGKNNYSKGSAIEYVITTDGPIVKTENKQKINYQHYVDKQLFPIAESILLEYSPKTLNIFHQQLSLL